MEHDNLNFYSKIDTLTFESVLEFTQPQQLEHSSEILLSPVNYKIDKQFSIKFNIPLDLIDYRLNLLEVNTEDNYIIIGLKNKVGLIPFNFNKTRNSNFQHGKIQYILQCQDLINQIKLMRNKANGANYLLALENSGMLHTKKLVYHNKTMVESDIKTFNAKINYHDKSIWSIDCHYPYIAIGGNHKCVLVFNVEDSSSSSFDHHCRNSICFTENTHNVPYVKFSPCGGYIGSACIDSFIRIWDVYNRKFVIKLGHFVKEMGWGVYFIQKDLFSIRSLSASENSTRNNIDAEMSEELRTSLGLNAKMSDNHNPDILTISNEYYENTLVNYIILSTSKQYMSLDALTISKVSNGPKQVKLGSVNLLKNLVDLKFPDSSNLSYQDVINIKILYEYSRYEFIFLSEALKVLILGNRMGDVQIYELGLEITKVSIGMSTPICIIDCGTKLAGMRIHECINEKEAMESYLHVYVLKLNGNFESFKFSLKPEDFN